MAVNLAIYESPNVFFCSLFLGGGGSGYACLFGIFPRIIIRGKKKPGPHRVRSPALSLFLLALCLGCETTKQCRVFARINGSYSIPVLYFGFLLYLFFLPCCPVLIWFFLSVSFLGRVWRRVGAGSATKGQCLLCIILLPLIGMDDVFDLVASRSGWSNRRKGKEWNPTYTPLFLSLLFIYFPLHLYFWLRRGNIWLLFLPVLG